MWTAAGAGTAEEVGSCGSRDSSVDPADRRTRRVSRDSAPLYDTRPNDHRRAIIRRWHAQTLDRSRDRAGTATDTPAPSARSRRGATRSSFHVKRVPAVRVHHDGRGESPFDHAHPCGRGHRAAAPSSGSHPVLLTVRAAGRRATRARVLERGRITGINPPTGNGSPRVPL